MTIPSSRPFPSPAPRPLPSPRTAARVPTTGSTIGAAMHAVPTRSPGSPTSRLQQAVHHALIPFGKMARPAVMFAAAESVGGDPLQVVPAAFGLECCHVGSLVHDDILDHDVVRRGRPSVLGAFDADTALVAGDNLMFMSFDWAADCLDQGLSPRRVLRAVTILAQAGHELCRGQMLEEDMARAATVDLDTYRSMVAGKTAALFSAAGQIGAVLGGGDTAAEHAWKTFGTEYGIAFQMEDDLLPYRRGGCESGKDPDSDIRNGRVTLPWLTSMRTAEPPVRSALLAAQQSAVQGSGTVDTAWVRTVLADPHNLAACDAIVRAHVDRATSALGPWAETDGGALILTTMEESRCRTR